MKASIHFELERPEDFNAFASLFGLIAGSGGRVSGAGTTINQPAPEPEKQISKPVEKPVKADPKLDEPADEDDDGAEEVEVEEITKAVVAADLRAFMTEKGKTGPREALAVLKQFGVTKFDDLQAEHYSKFLSALKKAA